MSGLPNVYPSLQIQVADPNNPLQEWANIQKTNADIGKTQSETVTENERPNLVRAQAELFRAQGGLAGAQTTKAQLENQLQVLMTLGKYNALTGGGGTGESGGGGGGGSSYSGQSSVPNSGETYKPGTSGASLVQTEGEGGGGTPAPSTQPGPVTQDAPRPVGPQEWNGGTGAVKPGSLASSAPPPANQLALYATQAAQNATPAAAPLTPATTPGAPISLAPNGGGVASSAVAQAPGGLNMNVPGPLPLNDLLRAQGGGGATPGVSANGTIVPGMSGPVPRAWTYDLWANNKSIAENVKALSEQRTAALGQLAGSANDRPSFDRAVITAYDRGLLTADVRDNLLQHDTNWQGIKNWFVQGLQTPSEQTSTVTAQRGQGIVAHPGGESLDANQQVQKDNISFPATVHDPNDKTGDPTKTVQQTFTYPRLAWEQASLGMMGPSAVQLPDGRIAVTGQVKGSNGEYFTQTNYLNPGDRIQVGGGQPAPGQQGANAPGGSWGGYLGNTQHAEIGNGPPRPNPNSTADGNYQFTEKTWLQQVKQNFPQVAAGKTDAQILALRGNKDFENQVMVPFTRQNAGQLAQANLPVNATTLHTAHWFGAEGAAKILRAPDANMTLGQAGIDQATLDANHISPDTRVGDLLAYEKKRFGLGKVDIGGTGGAPQNVAGGGGGTGGTQGAGPAASTPAPSPAPGSATNPGPAPNGGSVSGVGAENNVSGTVTAPAPSPAPGLPPGGIAGAVTVSPQQQADINVQQHAAQAQIDIANATAKKVAEVQGEMGGEIARNGYMAGASLEKLQILRNAMKDVQTGPSAEFRTAAVNRIIDTLGIMGIKVPDALAKESAAAGAIDKLGAYLASIQVRQMGDKAASVFDAVKNVNPALKSSPGAFKAVLDSLTQDATRDQDLDRFRAAWMQGHKNLDGMMDAFNDGHSVNAYASRVIPMQLPTDAKKYELNVVYNTAPGSKARKDGVAKVIWDGQQFHKADE